MKKYKLIKKYPHSPELGTEIEQDKRGHYCYGVDCIRKDQVEVFPEFWEEIPSYQILSFHAKNIGGKDRVSLDYIWKKYNGKWSRFVNNKFVTEPYTTEQILANPNYGIHSVKRLSDGQVFTIGDKIDSTISDLGRATELTGFKITDNKLKVGLRYLGYYPLSTIILPKKPLFKTFDSVDIFEGDNCWGVIDTYPWKVYQVNTKHDLDWIHKLTFSTKEAAEKYIEENKPKYSLNDVEKAYNTDRKNSFHTRKLETVIKNLKQLK